MVDRKVAIPPNFELVNILYKSSAVTVNGTVTRRNNSSRMTGRIDGLNFSVKDIGSNPARAEAESQTSKW